MDADFAALIENSQGWREIVLAVEAGRHPQAVAALLPSVGQEYFAKCYAQLMLGNEKGWSEGKHPDLIFAGSPEKAPSIEECRKLNEELALHPVTAERRLAVIWSADTLSPEAENSLLKLTEEPPANACILYVFKEDRLLPTIKSRVWSINIELPTEFCAAVKPPQTPSEWAEWFAKSSTGKKGEIDAVWLEMEGWINYYIEHKQFGKASTLELLTKQSKKKNMSLSMVQDIAFAALQEDISCEQIFGSIR